MQTSQILNDRIAEAVAQQRESIIGFLRELIAQTQHGEAAVQNVIAVASANMGCKVERVKYDPQTVPMIQEFASKQAITQGLRECIVAKIGTHGAGRSLLFFGHPDSEPLSRLDEWIHDPFKGEISQQRIYGWGVADDLAGVAIYTQAVAVLKACGLKPKGEVTLVSTPSKRHARGVSALLHQGLTADAAIYLHPAESGMGMREIKAFASGQLEFRIRVQGAAPPTTEPLQTAFAHLSVNPVGKAFEVFQALQQLDNKRGKEIFHPLLDEAVGRSTNIMVSMINCDTADSLSRVRHECWLGGAISFAPPEPMDQVMAQVQNVLDELAKRDPWFSAHPPQLHWESGVTGAQVNADHPLYQTLAGAIHRTTGHMPQVNPMHTSSDIRNPMVQKNIPTVGLGPLCGALSQNGQTDEWVDVTDYLSAVTVVASTILDWCGSESADS
jgi:acetylornithine deacetylase